jgi:uncharacterized protein DUF1707
MDNVGAVQTGNGTQGLAREAASRELAHAATAGGMTLGEYAERAEAIQEAATAEEIQAAVRGLPQEAAGAASARLGRWIIAILGGTRQDGRWRLGKHLWVLAAFGGARLDLAAAEPEGPASTITVIAILGGADILAPPGVPVELSGLSLLGGKGDRRSGGTPLPGSPVVRVRAFTFLGGVAIKESGPRRNLLDLLRSSHAEASGSD